MSSTFERFSGDTPMFGANGDYIEAIYEDYLMDAQSVQPVWRRYFDKLTNGHDYTDVAHSSVRNSFRGYIPASGVTSRDALDYRSAQAEKQAEVLRYINSYRVRGHQHADLDPLNLTDTDAVPDLDPAFHGLGSGDLSTVFNTGSLVADSELALREISRIIKQVYTGTIGSEYMHITSTSQKRWIQERLEGTLATLQTNPDEQRWLLRMLTAAEGIEQYLHRKYVGQKRFSLEGGEGLIPMLDDLIQRSGEHGIRELVIGMAHRGRLNVLVNIFGKDPCRLFAEFEGKHVDERTGSGDVKYHQGFSSDVDTPGGPVHLTLGFNPSHLEIVNPVIEGSVRARQRRRGDADGSQVLPVLIHGDSAFSGQGVVMETLNMSQARGYRTGGTVHIVINNQIGFTTSHPMDMRSTLYCTDVAKMVQAPIFHVNGDDPEAILFVTRLALDYRMTFNRDVVVDLVCYRRHGHNEADEPAVTQPLMYQKIRSHPTTRQIYADRLVKQHVIAEDEPDKMVEFYRNELDEGHIVSRPIIEGLTNQYAANWHVFRGKGWDTDYDSTYPLERLQQLQQKLLKFPGDFVLHPRVQRIMKDRAKMVAGDLPVDWGCAENLAYASLVADGVPVRLSGQDSGRGTFFHRHAVIHDQKTGNTWVPLQHIADDGNGEFAGSFIVIDSLLSEEAVLGFEYGYATADPRGLTLWEAQFGDFANGAQAVIDQFISAAEAKWNLFCGLVMLLPHGYEGQGPEHSSARLERYLHLSAEHNIQVCMPTTPAQIFHLLRRQIVRPYRKPLIVMSPKSLLRHKMAVSDIRQLTDGRFQNVIDDIDNPDIDKVKRLVICSGKIYYDLLAKKYEEGADDVAIMRLEQLYPFPHKDFAYYFYQYRNVKDVVWCQEEPQNQGAWYQVQHRLRKYIDATQVLHYVGRKASASPAVGYYSLHMEQQYSIVMKALYGGFEKKHKRK
jgi:2-oxoglutarate dehydrogenase E1 component